MAYATTRYWWIKTAFVFLLLAGINKSHAQAAVIFDSVSTKLMDSNLSAVFASDVFKQDKPLVIVSNTNCTGCVKYLTGQKRQFNFLFILSGESLLEARRLQRVYGLTAGQCYFTTCETIRLKKKEICMDPTPCLILKNNSGYAFYNYPQLDLLTEEFILKPTAFIKKLK